MEPSERVVVLIDMDCFYCQVEEKLNPHLKDKPIAVVQYNAWRGGGIIAVNYPARNEGVTRHMRGSDAKKKCPSINLVQVPEVRGKADLTKYRDAGKEVADVLANSTAILQRASVDEAYLDITELVEKKLTDLNDLTVENLANTFVVGSELKDFLHNVKANKEFSLNNLKLAVGGLITEEIRREVFIKTGYKCSAGIAHNKILAKLVCSFHKPNKQTILPQDAVDKLYETTPITKITGLGGKFGQSLTEDFHIKFMSELGKISEKQLAQKYDEKSASWLYNLARGVDTEPVTTKILAKSIACCKNFPGITALMNSENVELWLSKLSEEISERLEKDFTQNNRKAKQIIVSFVQEINKKDVSSSRTHPLVSYDPKKISRAAFEVIKKHCLRSDGSYHVKFLGLSAGHFQDVTKMREITTFFQVGPGKNNQNNKNQRKMDETCNKQQQFFQSEPERNHHENESTSSITEEEFREAETFTEDVFGQVTQELDEKPDELIFYDDSCRVTELNGSTELNSSDSFTDQVAPENSDLEPKVSTDLNQSSFFAKYFVKEVAKDTETEQPEQNETSELPDETPLEIEERSELCNECQKLIPVSELMSHQDYHFALKLSREERMPQKQNTTQTKPEDKTNGQKRGRPKGIKRKVNNNSSLIKFITKNEESSDFTETCPECNKKIKVEEMSSHKDYHTAKKIHLEINAINPTKPVKSGKTQKSNRSVISFFRPA